MSNDTINQLREDHYAIEARAAKLKAQALANLSDNATSLRMRQFARDRADFYAQEAVRYTAKVVECRGRNEETFYRPKERAAEEAATK